MKLYINDEEVDVESIKIYTECPAPTGVVQDHGPPPSNSPQDYLHPSNTPIPVEQKTLSYNSYTFSDCDCYTVEPLLVSHKTVLIKDDEDPRRTLLQRLKWWLKIKKD